MPDGRPQVNSVWCDDDGTYVRVNAASDWQKRRNMRNHSVATILLVWIPRMHCFGWKYVGCRPMG